MTLGKSLTCLSLISFHVNWGSPQHHVIVMTTAKPHCINTAFSPLWRHFDSQLEIITHCPDLFTLIIFAPIIFLELLFNMYLWQVSGPLENRDHSYPPPHGRYIAHRGRATHSDELKNPLNRLDVTSTNCLISWNHWHWLLLPYITYIILKMHIGFLGKFHTVSWTNHKCVR